MIRQLTLQETQTYLSDDSVRPHLSAAYRNDCNRQVWALFEDQYASAHQPSPEPLAVICVAYTNAAPRDEFELGWFSSACASGAVTANTAVFYTVWSYARGAGRQIVNSVAEHIRSTQPEITRWVTLSPLTDMAEQFHLRNGARLHSKHTTCQIFEYTRLMQSAESKQARSA